MRGRIESPEDSAEWHYEQAMALLRLDDEVPPDEWRADVTAAVIVAEAQVHATLALYRIQATEAQQ